MLCSSFLGEGNKKRTFPSVKIKYNLSQAIKVPNSKIEAFDPKLQWLQVVENLTNFGDIQTLGVWKNISLSSFICVRNFFWSLSASQDSKLPNMTWRETNIVFIGFNKINFTVWETDKKRISEIEKVVHRDVFSNTKCVCISKIDAFRECQIEILLQN